MTIADKLDQALFQVGQLGLRSDRLSRKDGTPRGGPVITLELAPGFDNLQGFIDFLQTIKDIASTGHSFEIGADTDFDGTGGKMFGKQRCAAVCFMDGDGSDHIARILVDGKEYKPEKPR